ncbi:MAG: adenine phosphoribosyltransferase [Paludibacteraceae bacterium]|nr:adenine phosphoribosyltransferase [Paludibacteraceae bacterium]
MTEQEVIRKIRVVPDFPKKGIMFMDITTALADAECLQWFTNKIVDIYKKCGITKVMGIESRGFIVGAIAAKELGAGFVPIRKKGKLPADVIQENYEKEYGIDTIEIHKDAITPDDVVLIHDDILATGGTIEAAIKLAKKVGVKKIYVNFLLELKELEGTKKIPQDIEVVSLLSC